MLDLDNIQHILVTRTPAMTGRYEFLSFSDAAGGREWLSGLLDKVQSAADVRRTMDSSDRWITLAFTWNGLRALGVPEDALATFPDEFREGMAARADILGDRGANHPANWVGGVAGDDLHAIAILFARNEAEHRRCTTAHAELVARCPGVRVLSYLDLNATPPFNYAHDHFGYRDRLSQPVIEGSGEDPLPGSGAPLKPGEFILGYPDEEGVVPDLPVPEQLSRNGSYLAYRRLREHVGLFRDYLAQHADTADGQELLAAKLMGRWRSGAPLVLSPDHDDPDLGADPLRNNDFNYKEQDPVGYAVPLGSHIRRLNPRDTAVNMNRRRMIRRGATYGTALPDGAPDDGADRGIAAFIICGSLIRQFEFAQNVWINDRNFHELGNERDPITGNQDGTLEYKIPRRPIRKVLKGLPAFTTLTGGAYFFLPGLNGLRYLAEDK
jgi:Dyp-type peroxidase family